MMTMLTVALLLFSGSALWATNIQFTAGPEIVHRNIADNRIVVQFSLGWDNSWNLNSPPNHDAAWIFMKYRQFGHHGFHHANLHQVENIVRGAESTRHNVRYGMSERLHGGSDIAVGVFLSRSEISVGSNVFNDVELHWDISETNITEETVLSVRVFAIEMVFIPPGAFTSPNVDPGTGRPVFALGGAPVVTHPRWPIGGNPFYIMKHEVTQHAWVDFLNTLTLQQQTRLSHIPPTSPNYTRFRDATPAPTNFAGVARMFIRIREQATRNTPAVFGINAQVGNPSGPDAWDHEVQGGNVPMFGLAWTDALAYLDWAGLRPLTELEYEKAVTGEIPLVAGTFAWGTADVGQNIIGGFSNPRGPNELPGNDAANRAFPNVAGTAAGTTHTQDIANIWPIRVGAFARGESTRFEAGASFWGVLNMSDNVAERFVSFGHAAGSGIGRQFTGAHGDGNLTGDGLANVPCWPGRALALGANTNEVGGTGSGYRGMGLTTAQTMNAWASAAASNRAQMGQTAGDAANRNVRDPWTGMRGGRGVPIEFSVHRQPARENRAALQSGYTVGGVGTIFTHSLTVSVIGTDGDVQFQWFSYCEELGEMPIDGATNYRFFPPSNLAHGPRSFFATITDLATGQVITSEQSGRHTVMGVLTQPSQDNITTSLTQGTNELTVAPSGGVGPFTMQWFLLLNGTPGVVSTAGTLIPGAFGVNATHRPIIPLPGNNYTFFAVIRDVTTGLSVRTVQSGLHSVGIPTPGGNNGVWIGAAQGTGSGRQGAAPATPIAVTLQPGVYRLEAWGASGGRGGNAVTGALSPTSRWGGYAQTHIRITVPTQVFVVPGGAGGDGVGLPREAIVPGGFNGGGNARVARNNDNFGGGGGGASHISFVSGTIDNENVRNNIIIVAGGAGGGADRAAGTGAFGGGTIGQGVHVCRSGSGGTQLAGGAVGVQLPGGLAVAVRGTGGTAGQGGSGYSHMTGGAGGGGGGWFGGGGGSGCNDRAGHPASTGGGGGSGHVSSMFVIPANAFVPGMPASRPQMPPLAAQTGPTAAPTAAINHATAAGNTAATTPRHPGTMAGEPVASTTNVLGGAVRIIRLQ